MQERTSKWITFGVLLTLAVVLVVAVFLQVWQPLLLAAVIVGTLGPLYERLAQRLRGRRALASGMVSVGVLLVFVVPLGFLLGYIVKEGVSATATVREALSQGGVDELLERLPAPARRVVHKILSWIPPDAEKQLAAEAKKGGSLLAGAAAGALNATWTLLFYMATMLIAVYFLFMDGHRLVDWLARVSPLEEPQMRELFGEFRRTAHSVLMSTVLTAAAQGAVATVGYLIAGVPRALFFGLLTFFAAFIPSVGTAVVALPLCALLFLLGHPWAALFLLAWSIGVVAVIDNLLKPYLIKGGMHLHGALVFFSLVGGILLFGAIGLAVGPLALSFFMAMVRLGRRDFPTTTPAAS